MKIYFQVRDFFRGQRNIGSGQRALDQSMEQIKINIQWRSSSEEAIRAWINGQIGDGKEGAEQIV